VQNKIVGVILVLVGIGLAIGGFVSHSKQKKLDAEGKTARAEIVGGESRSGRRGSKTYNVELRYQTESRQTVNKKFSVSKSTFESAQNQGVGGALQVTYLPSDPQTARVVGDSSSGHVVMYVLGPILALVGAFMVVKQS
jgi:hypothetical protein